MTIRYWNVVKALTNIIYVEEENIGRKDKVMGEMMKEED